jgi:hypothetical protein
VELATSGNEKEKKSSAAIFFFLFFTNVIYSCKNAKFEKLAVMQRAHKKKRKNRPSPIFFFFFRFRKSPTPPRSTWSAPFSTISVRFGYNLSAFLHQFYNFFRVFCNFLNQNLLCLDSYC